jgi:hypothetical protein
MEFPTKTFFTIKNKILDLAQKNCALTKYNPISGRPIAYTYISCITNPFFAPGKVFSQWRNVAEVVLLD